LGVDLVERKSGWRTGMVQFLMSGQWPLPEIRRLRRVYRLEDDTE
jgi:hypothetical protein